MYDCWSVIVDGGWCGLVEDGGVGDLGISEVD